MTKQLLDSSHLYNRYRIKIEVRERLDGGVPKDPKLIEGWVAAKTGHDDEKTKKLVEEHMPDIDPVTEGVAEGMWTGFKKDDTGHYIETRQVKALFRESATMLSITKKKRGSKQILQHGFEVRGENGGSKIYLGTDGDGEKLIIEQEEKAIHVMTRQGPRSAIKRCDFATNAVLEWEVWILRTAPAETRRIGKTELELMLTHAQENGLGANRSQGSGKFDVTEFEVLHEDNTAIIPSKAAS